ncbi:transposase [Chryseobacterium phosphatilyticum]|uniref:Transposase n=1 Tax=Chryseobacterium phosphatilyticum TaxID=475075 RepID=A0A316X6P9_9FLAO|nr:transposase [Chryseobacterium phosphatilyticum]
MDLKNIHIGSLISLRIEECKMEAFRICNFLKRTEEELNSILLQKTLDTEILLKFSILLEYDFFRLYSQYLILYAPPANLDCTHNKNTKSNLPQYRKNIYTRELVDFILEQIENGSKTKVQIIEEYRIPKSTLYKWQNKYKPTKKTQ